MEVLDRSILCQKRGLERVMIHTDNLEMITTIQDQQSTGSNSILVRRNFQVLQDIRQWCLRYVPREETKITDYLAKMSFDRKESISMLMRSLERS